METEYREKGGLRLEVSVMETRAAGLKLIDSINKYAIVLHAL